MHASPVDLALSEPSAGTLRHTQISSLIAECPRQSESRVGCRAHISTQLRPVISEVVEPWASSSAPAISRRYFTIVDVKASSQTSLRFVAIRVCVDGCRMRAVEDTTFGGVLCPHVSGAVGWSDTSVGLVLGVGEDRSR
jgi:hypothetical protein